MKLEKFLREQFPVDSIKVWSKPSAALLSQEVWSVTKSLSRSSTKRSRNQNQPRESSWTVSQEPEDNLTNILKFSQSTVSWTSLSEKTFFWKNLWEEELVSTVELASTSATFKGKFDLKIQRWLFNGSIVAKEIRYLRQLRTRIGYQRRRYWKGHFLKNERIWC